MNTLVISIGSNSKDKEWQITNCITWLKKNLSGCHASSIYDSQAANGKDPDYLNAVMKAKCKEEFEDINDKLKKYEAVCGRTPMSKLVGEIPIDLDIVLWNDDIVRPKDFSQPYFQKGWQQFTDKR